MNSKGISNLCAVAYSHSCLTSSHECLLRTLICCGALMLGAQMFIPPANAAAPPELIPATLPSAQPAPPKDSSATGLRGRPPELEKRSVTSLKDRHPEKGPPPEVSSGLISPGKERPER